MRVRFVIFLFSLSSCFVLRGTNERVVWLTISFFFVTSSSGTCGQSSSGRIASTSTRISRKSLTSMLDQFDLISSLLLSFSSLFTLSLSFPSSLASSRFSLALFSLFRDPRDYLKQVMKVTNMSCLTPDGALSGNCDFLSANMYARSLFGKSLLHEKPMIWRISIAQNYRELQVRTLSPTSVSNGQRRVRSPAMSESVVRRKASLYHWVTRLRWVRSFDRSTLSCV